MANVYVVQAVPGRDLTQAMQYGDIVEVFDPKLQLYGDTRFAVRAARHKLKDATENDYIILMGDMSLCGLAFAEFVSVTGGRIKVLKWDRFNGAGGGYKVIDIDMAQSSR